MPFALVLLVSVAAELAPPAAPAPGPTPEVTRALERCQVGDLRACAQAAARFRTGYGAPRDDARALDLAERGCAAGEPAGCLELSRLEARQQPARAAELLEKARRGLAARCGGKDKDVVACADLAWLAVGDRLALPEPERKRLVARLEPACARNDLASCTRLGLALTDLAAEGAEDSPRALGLLARACEGGFTAGCRLQARLEAGMAQGEGAASRARGRAFLLLGRACTAGDPASCNALAWSFLSLVPASGGGAAVSGEATALLRQACDGGFLLACVSLAHQLYFEEPRDPAQARAALERACLLREPEACAVLGHVLAARWDPTSRVSRFTGSVGEVRDVGDGFPADRYGVTFRPQSEVPAEEPDATASREAYRTACLLGASRVCLDAARAYAGVSTAEALACTQRACEGEPRLCLYLGDLHGERALLDVAGVPRDLDAAAAAFGRGCAALGPGYDDEAAAGCERLADLYRSGGGAGTPQQAQALEEKVAQVARSACAPEHPGRLDGACAKLAEVSAAGRGMPRDLALAQQLYQGLCDRWSPSRATGGQVPLACGRARTVATARAAQAAQARAAGQAAAAAQAAASAQAAAARAAANSRCRPGQVDPGRIRAAAARVLAADNDDLKAWAQAPTASGLDPGTRDAQLLGAWQAFLAGASSYKNGLAFSYQLFSEAPPRKDRYVENMSWDDGDATYVRYIQRYTDSGEIWRSTNYQGYYVSAMMGKAAAYAALFELECQAGVAPAELRELLRRGAAAASAIYVGTPTAYRRAATVQGRDALLAQLERLAADANLDAAVQAAPLPEVARGQQDLNDALWWCIVGGSGDCEREIQDGGDVRIAPPSGTLLGAALDACGTSSATPALVRNLMRHGVAPSPAELRAASTLLRPVRPGDPCYEAALALGASPPAPAPAPVSRCPAGSVCAGSAR